MKKTRHSMQGGDRYAFDFELCTSRKGWAQVDTTSDASYHGVWANPGDLKLCSYCEGDVTVTECEAAEEFVGELRRVVEFYADGFKGIDPGLGSELPAKFRALGVGDLLWEERRPVEAAA